MNTLLNELWPLIIDHDWCVYAGLLAIPKFARLTMKDPVKWKTLLTIEIKQDDCVKWTLANKLHRDGDLPAVIYAGGSQHWCQHGEHHRDGDLPAIIRASGRRCWCQHGKCHRDGDLPAVIDVNGSQRWYQRGELHRDGDLPAIIWADGRQEWWINGVCQK